MNDTIDKIYVSHINIRQSISLLLTKILVIETVAALVVIIFHSLLFSFVLPSGTIHLITIFGMPIFVVLVTIKMLLSLYIIIDWLNEYYEVSAHFIMHRRGVLYKHEEKYAIDQVAFIEINQGMLGRLCNYGSIRLLNMRRYEYLDMYLIHNPFRYAAIIKELNPKAAEINSTFARTTAQLQVEEEP